MSKQNSQTHRPQGQKKEKTPNLETRHSFQQRNGGQQAPPETAKWVAQQLAEEKPEQRIGILRLWVNPKRQVKAMEEMIEEINAGRGNLKKCENLKEMVEMMIMIQCLRSQMLCSMTKLKGLSHLVALLQVPTPKDTSVPDGVLDTNSVPPPNCEPVMQPCRVMGF
jgi:hypothetical protein